ncbi:MAG: alginate export family protein, partial [Planctomycetota bacterium]
MFDQLKHVGDGDVWASFGGRFDTRMESWEGFGFGATNPGNSDTFLLTHLFLHGELHLGSRVRAYVEAYGADVWGRNDLPGGRRTLDTNSLDLFQGFVDLDLLEGDDQLRLRVGRQTLLFGAQRVVSPLPWANTWRTWDGVSAELRTGEWTVTGFATYYVPVQKHDFDDSDDSQEFYGVYASLPANQAHRGLDVYLIGKSRDNVTVNGTSGNERRHTLGARTFGSLGGAWDGELEGAYQFGEVGAGDVSAWFVSSVLGYKLPDCPLQSRWFVGFDAASGDHNVGGNVTTYDQVFPLGHAYFGYADMLARQNVIAANLGAQLTLDDATKATVAAHVFRLYDDNDALYSVGGPPARTGLGNADVG